jgi:hypothetical protein
MTARISISQVLATIVVVGGFAAFSIWLGGFLAAIPYPHWYADMSSSHKGVRLFLWALLERGMPDALLAAVSAVVLARLTRGAGVAVILIALGIWLLAPVAFDLTGPITLAEEIDGIRLFWPDIVVQKILVCAAFLVAFRYTLQRVPRAPARA